MNNELYRLILSIIVLLIGMSFSFTSLIFSFKNRNNNGDSCTGFGILSFIIFVITIIVSGAIFGTK